MKLLVEFEIPPRPNFPENAESIVADTVQRVLRANTDPDCEVNVSLFVPSPPVNAHPFPTP
ncbi:MAG: hypothetical protein ABMA26_07410 [Limisphaerales bacterium]